MKMKVKSPLIVIERALVDQLVPAPVQGDSAYGNSFAFRAHLRELKLPFNDRLGPSENVDRGLPCPRLLPQYFEPVPGYGLGICDDRVVASHHPGVIAVQFHLRNLLGKVGGTGIKELLIVLLDFRFSVHHLESGQKLDKSRIFRELCRDPAGISLVVQFAALGDDILSSSFIASYR